MHSRTDWIRVHSRMFSVIISKSRCVLNSPNMFCFLFQSTLNNELRFKKVACIMYAHSVHLAHTRPAIEALLVPSPYLRAQSEIAWHYGSTASVGFLSASARTLFSREYIYVLRIGLDFLPLSRVHSKLSIALGYSMVLKVKLTNSSKAANFWNNSLRVGEEKEPRYLDNRGWVRRSLFALIIYVVGQIGIGCEDSRITVKYRKLPSKLITIWLIQCATILAYS